MPIIVSGEETYLYISGLSVSKELKLSDNLTLLPIERQLDLNCMARILKNDVDFATSILCAQNCKAQLRVTANNSEELALRAWDAQWDVILLDAILGCNAMCNIQGNAPADSLCKDSFVNIMNYHIHGILQKPYQITDEDAQWIHAYFENATSLLDSQTSFMTAVHSMASFRWHSLPRIQLAILWAGIEALFGVTSELVFRISLYIANFLSDDIREAYILFSKTKKLYGARSSAVHGSKMKKIDEPQAVRDSAELLKRLIRKCVETNHMPVPEDLTFFQQDDISDSALLDEGDDG